MSTSGRFHLLSWRALVLPLFLVFVSCSSFGPESGSHILFRPPPPDSQTGDGAVRLIWNSHFEPFSDWSSQPTESPDEVEVLISNESASEGFEQLAVRDGGIADTLVVSGLQNGKTYYVKIRYKWGVAPSLPSPAIAIVPGPLAPPVQSLAVNPVTYDEVGATWSPDGMSVAYAEQAGRVEILRVDGSITTRIFSPLLSGFLSDLAWSPDGEEIACTSSPSRTAGEIDYRIWMVRVLDGAVRSVSPGSVDFDAAWSPTAESFVFCRGTREPPNIPELYRMRSDGELAPEKITSDRRYYKYQPAVRRTDGRIAFEARTSSTIRRSLYQISRDGGQIEELVVHPDWDDYSVDWSPGGSRVLLTSTRSGHPDVWIYDLPTRAARPLTTGTASSVRSRRATWSPDGGRIAVLETRGDGASSIDFYAAP